MRKIEPILLMLMCLRADWQAGKQAGRLASRFSKIIYKLDHLDYGLFSTSTALKCILYSWLFSLKGMFWSTINLDVIFITITTITAQLTPKFTLVSAIHVCVLQLYSSDQSELACYTWVRLLMLHSSQSQVLHLSQSQVSHTSQGFCAFWDFIHYARESDSSVVHASQTSCMLHACTYVRLGMLHANKIWQAWPTYV